MKKLHLIVLLCALLIAAQGLCIAEEVLSGPVEVVPPEEEFLLGMAETVPEVPDTAPVREVLADADEEDPEPPEEFEIEGLTLVKYNGAGGDVEIPDDVLNIGARAFSGCSNLTSVTLPESVQNIAANAFENCTGLTRVTVETTENVLFAASAFTGCPDGLTFYTVCETDATLWAEEQGYNVVKSDHVTEVVEGYPATCSASGLSDGEQCTVCGKITKAQAVTDPLPHTPVVEPGTPATCSQSGLSDGLCCAECGAELQGQALIDPLPHTPIVIPGTPSTCTKEGLSDGAVCAVCGETIEYQYELDLAEHTPEAIPDVPPTYTTPGWTEGSRCAVCGEVLDEPWEVDPLEVPEGCVLLAGNTSAKAGTGDSFTLLLNGVAAKSFKSGDKKVATVSKAGKVTTKKPGKATLTAVTADGQKLKLKLTVKDTAAFSSKTAYCVRGESATLKLKHLGNRSVTWSSSNTSVVKVTGKKSGSATIKGLKYGTATVSAKVKGGKTLKCKVTVGGPVEVAVEGLHDAPIYNDLDLSLINHSGKKVIYVKLSIAQYNNRGDKLRTGLSYYYNDTIAAHDSGWKRFWVHRDTKRVSVKITEVTFKNGTRWKP